MNETIIPNMQTHLNVVAVTVSEVSDDAESYDTDHAIYDIIAWRLIPGFDRPVPVAAGFHSDVFSWSEPGRATDWGIYDTEAREMVDGRKMDAFIKQTAWEMARTVSRKGWPRRAAEWREA